MAKWNRTNNCYSYAVNYPNKWLLIEDSYRNGVYQILDKNPNFYLIDKKDMVLGKEYIAYRFGADDFHFMRRGKNGHWRHKMGTRPVVSISRKEVFSKYWDSGDNIYNSKLYLFEIR